MMQKKAKKLDTSLEVRRKWCVEQAIKWPQVGSVSMMSGGGYSDADVIGRAEKLEAYITNKTVNG